MDLSDGEDGWMDMPVLRSTGQTTTGTARFAIPSSSSSSYRSNGARRHSRATVGEESSRKRRDQSSESGTPTASGSGSSGSSSEDEHGYRKRKDMHGKGSAASRRGRGGTMHNRRTMGPIRAAAQMDDDEPIPSPLLVQATSPNSKANAQSSSNATGNLIDFDDEGAKWQEKAKLEEDTYTRLELDEDPEEDEVHTRTDYLFNSEAGMTPLSQMQATKTMLSEGQRIAYVGLCKLVSREMGLKMRGVKELEPCIEGLQNWATKIMGRLYQHMEIEPAEQRMIEQLAEHGVTAADLVPSLVVTHTMPNPEYDPEAERERDELREEEAKERAEEEAEEALRENMQCTSIDDEPSTPTARRRRSSENTPSTAEDQATTAEPENAPTPHASPRAPAYDIEDEEAKTPSRAKTLAVEKDTAEDPLQSPRARNALNRPLPGALPGTSQSLTAADKTITLDIRWTILCDLFLALIADSVYDSRSRVLLGRIADLLGLSWMDVIRFERRLTEALEIQEGIAKKENNDVLELRAKMDKKKRYMMMGLATLGGGLVIGLSAGLLAPVIGAGIGGALAGVGVSGATTFLGGAGGAAVITTGGVLTGSSIGGRGMARRTKHVEKFDFMPLHNNKRLNAFITIPGFMNGSQDDVRLPFSVMDPIMGDVFSVLWEPDTLGRTGNALKILTSEVLSSVGQQVLQATLLSAMMTALQWPIILTKLGYLIDNPWSNALDRAKQAGAVLAQILINRTVGVRPISLIGFSLGARVLFYTLVNLAKQKALGIVQDVYLLGATVTASSKVWREVRGVVAGRFVNAYARNDWVLGYLFRATTGGLQTVAGLRPVEFVPDMENVDITDLLAGHMSYRSLMPVILDHLGFRVTADHFDEPEDLGERPDREIVTPEMELARLEQQKKSTWLSRFKKGGKNVADARRASLEAQIAEREAKRRGSADSIAARDTAVKTSAGKGPAAAKGETASTVGNADEDEDLPPRLSSGESPYSQSAPRQGSSSQLSSADTDKKASSSSLTMETKTASGVSSPVPSPSASVENFDIARIRSEIAKDDGSGQLPTSSSTAMEGSAEASRTSLDLPGTSALRQELHRADTAPHLSTLADVRGSHPAEQSLPDDDDQQSYLPENSKPLQSPYLTNPFASSTATLSAENPFAFPSTSRQPPSASTLSFAGEDGRIDPHSSLQTSAFDINQSPWGASQSGTASSDGQKAGAQDPWGASNVWGSSRW